MCIGEDLYFYLFYKYVNISNMNLEEIKAKLLEEKEKLLNGIKKISILDNGNYIAKETNTQENDVLDNVDLASEQTNFSNNQAILKELKIRLNNIDKALTRINTGEYGDCIFCGEEINLERILANASATGCIKCVKN